MKWAIISLGGFPQSRLTSVIQGGRGGRGGVGGREGHPLLIDHISSGMFPKPRKRIREHTWRQFLTKLKIMYKIKKLRLRSQFFFHWKWKIWSLEIWFVTDRGREHILCLRFFEKIRYFTLLDRMSGIRSVSGIRPTCLCWCPPLHRR
jgi:hypothetical protein